MKKVTLLFKDDVQEAALIDALINQADNLRKAGSTVVAPYLSDLLNQVHDTKEEVHVISGDTYLLAQVRLYDGMRKGTGPDATYDDCCKRAKHVVDHFLHINSMEVK